MTNLKRVLSDYFQTKFAHDYHRKLQEVFEDKDGKANKEANTDGQ